MSIRKFKHGFSPNGHGTSAFDPIELTTTEIAQAALIEITQISLTAVPFNLFLDQLLVPNSDWFQWISQLGQIRETKTALSGLFGRFVARAYLTRYFNFKYFEPLKSLTQPFVSWPNFTIARKRNYTGDLPDWIVASMAGANTLAIAEAKGSYNSSGPNPQLKSAIKQAAGINVKSGATVLVIKRFAISTRWSVQHFPKLQFPWLVVDDPADGTREPTEEEMKQLSRSVALGHFAALAEGLGLVATARALEKAKISEPGNLQLPESEQVEITQDGKPLRTAIASAVTPSGIVKTPEGREPGDFLQSLRTTFGSRVTLLSVDTSLLGEIDRDGAAKSKIASVKGDEVEDENGDILGKEHSLVDGSELIPADRIQLKRRPQLDSKKDQT